MSHRSLQVGHIIRDEVARVINQFFSTNRYGLLTITAVEVAPKFDSARVLVSCLKNSHQFEEDAKRFVHQIQQVVNQKLPIKKVPKIIFRVDTSSKTVAKIDELLSKINP